MARESDVLIGHIRTAGSSDPARQPTLPLSWGRTDKAESNDDMLHLGRDQQIFAPPIAFQKSQDTGSVIANQTSSKPFATGLRTLVRNPAQLTQRRLHIVERLWTVVLSKALQSGFRPRAAIDVEHSREEGDAQIVLRVYVNMSAAQAFAFWDGLEPDLERWLTHLDRPSRDAAMRDVALRLHWNV